MLEGRRSDVLDPVYYTPATLDRYTSSLCRSANLQRHPGLNWPCPYAVGVGCRGSCCFVAVGGRRFALSVCFRSRKNAGLSLRSGYDTYINEGVAGSNPAAPIFATLDERAQTFLTRHPWQRQLTGSTGYNASRSLVTCRPAAPPSGCRLFPPWFRPPPSR